MNIRAQIITSLVQAVRRDRANRYTLLAPWALPRLAIDVPDYDGDLIRIRNRVVTVLPYDTESAVCDGATLAPDRIGPWRMVIGTLLHDPWYIEMHHMAARWNWPLKRVRRLGDLVFYGILAEIGPTWLARLYYRAVRIFGGIFHGLGRIFAIALLALCVAGCDGCASPGPIFEDPSDLTIPDYATVLPSPP